MKTTNKKGINVLSLFDGISCARVSLSKLGIKVNRYYASEIDAHAIAISKKNYPDIIQMGGGTTHLEEDGKGEYRSPRRWLSMPGSQHCEERPERVEGVEKRSVLRVRPNTQGTETEIFHIGERRLYA